MRAWKEIAEDRALNSIGKTLTPVVESESQRKLRAILPFKGLMITLSQINSGRAAFTLGRIASSSPATLFDCSEFHVRVGKTGVDGWSRSVPMTDIEVCFDERGQLELREPRT
jgi:hypothetical protein